jgi:tRNA pseudouridine38-40 synthase
MRFIAFIVAYDGTDFHGFQRQSNGRSVQRELERALEQVLKHPAPISMAGRTDAGVHATGQCCRFQTMNPIPAERIPLALNRVLDRAVRVVSARDVEEQFHPRFSAKSRTYRYTIDNAPIANPLLWRVAGHVRDELNVEKMQEAAGAFEGEHDFASWQSAGSPNGPTIRLMHRVEVRRATAFGSPLVEVELEANAFLYQMVRNIVGALIECGRGKLRREDIEVLMRGLDRTKCPPPAPPQGLCLVEVTY